TEEELNEVNTPSVAEERGIDVSETRNASARDFTDLVRVTVVAGDSRERVVGTTLGRRDRPHLLEAWGGRFNLQLEDHVTLFRYRDVPGMIGRIGTVFGEQGGNIVSAAVGRRPAGEGEGADATMAITTDLPVAPDVLAALTAGDEFVAARTVNL
ncbi:MAG: ACT domain-containing protein, partial [Solirubrobacteraceae bacterium]